MTSSSVVWKDITSYERGEKLQGVSPRTLSTAIKGFPLTLRYMRENEYQLTLTGLSNPYFINIAASNMDEAKPKALCAFQTWVTELLHEVDKTTLPPSLEEVTPELETYYTKESSK